MFHEAIHFHCSSYFFLQELNILVCLTARFMMLIVVKVASFLFLSAVTNDCLQAFRDIVSVHIVYSTLSPFRQSLLVGPGEQVPEWATRPTGPELTEKYVESVACCFLLACASTPRAALVLCLQYIWHLYMFFSSLCLSHWRTHVTATCDSRSHFEQQGRQHFKVIPPIDFCIGWSAWAGRGARLMSV